MSQRDEIARVVEEAWELGHSGAPRPLTVLRDLAAGAVSRRFAAAGLLVPPESERVEAMVRLLVDSGDMTPTAARQIRRVLSASFLDTQETLR